MYNFLCNELDYSINTLEGYLLNKSAKLSFDEFDNHYTSGNEYYFIAYVYE